MIPNYNNYVYPTAVNTGIPNNGYQTAVPLAQMPQQNVQRTYLNGKYISGENDILPSEVPMDGNRSYFPFVDEGKIIVKYWDSNGKIVTKVYVLDEAVRTDNQPDILESINSRFDMLEKLLNNKLNNQNFKHNNNQNSNNKKEADA